MYGFVQDVDDNFYDTVDVELAVFYDILTSADFSFCLTQDKVNWLRKKGKRNKYIIFFALNYIFC